MADSKFTIPKTATEAKKSLVAGEQIIARTVVQPIRRQARSSAATPSAPCHSTVPSGLTHTLTLRPPCRATRW